MIVFTVGEKAAPEVSEWVANAINKVGEQAGPLQGVEASVSITLAHNFTLKFDAVLSSCRFAPATVSTIAEGRFYEVGPMLCELEFDQLFPAAKG